MAKIRSRFDKGIRIRKENIEGVGGDDLTLDGELGYDSDDENLKARLDGATRSVITNNQTQTLENKSIDGTAATGNNTISADADNISYDNSTSGLTATDVKAAIDELQTGLENQNEASEIAYDNTTSGLIAITVQAAIDEVEGRVDTAESDITTNATNLSDHLADAVDAHDASAISYDNATSGLTATDAQAALDEIEGRVNTIEGASYVNSFNSRTGAVVPAASDYDAVQIDYDNSTSGLTATDAQAAIDEVEGRLDTAETNITANQAHVAASSDVHGIGATADVVGTDTTQALTNKDIDGGTASDTSRLTVPQDTKSNLDGLTRKEATIVYANDEDTLYVDDGTNLLPVGSGGAGFKNYVTNPDAEQDLGNVTVYSNTSAGDAPDDFGGTPSGNLSLTRNTTTPLAGNADFQISSTATNLQGEGVYWELDAIDKIDYASILTTIIGKDASDSGLADGDYKWYIVSSDDSFATILKVELLGDLAGSTNDDIFQFQSLPDSGISYRLCLHKAVTTATATDLYIDDVRVGPRETKVGSSSQIELEAYGNGGESITPSVTAIPFVTVRDTLDSWDGSRFTAQKTGAYSLDGFVLFTAAASRFFYLYVDRGSGFVREYAIGSSSALSTPLSGLVFLEKGDQFEIRVQPTGGTLWTVDNTQHYLNVKYVGIAETDAGIAGLDVFVEGRNNSGESITENVTPIPFIEVTDTTGSWSGSQFTAPVAGRYAIEGMVSFSASTSLNLSIYKNSSELDQVTPANPNGTQGKFSSIVDLQKDDVIELRKGSGSATLSSASDSNWIKIIRIAPPQTLFGSKNTTARYTTNSGQSIPNTTETVVVFDTKDFDTDAGMNTSTGVYTIPESGYYSISSRVWLQGLSGGVAQLTLRKNGAVFSDGGYFSSLGSGAGMSFSGSSFYLEKDENVSISAFHNGGGSVSLDGARGRCSFEIIKVG